MNVTSTRTTLQVDDYLDLLNLAVKVGDLKWQKKLNPDCNTFFVCRQDNLSEYSPHSFRECGFFACMIGSHVRIGVSPRHVKVNDIV